MIPLLDTTLLTNAPGEPRLLHQLQAEIESADAIDLVMAFIRGSGINPLMPILRRHLEAGRPLACPDHDLHRVDSAIGARPTRRDRG